MQFSLRTLLIGATLCALALGIWADQVRPYYVEQRALRHIRNCGGEIRMEPLGPKWVSWIWGENRQQRVAVVTVNADLKPADEIQIFSALRQFHCLRVLTLRSANLNDERLRSLAANKSLETLTLEVCAIEGRLALLSGCRRLSELNVIGMERDMVAPGAIGSLATLTQLQSLRFRSHDLSANDLQCLQLCTGLRCLDLRGGHLGDDLLPSLAALADLKYLDLRSNQLSGTGLMQLSRLVKLRELRLGLNPLGDDGLEVLKFMPQLRTLDLSYTQITDLGLRRLASLTQLEELNLAGTQVSDTGLQGIANLKSLAVLRLDETSLRGMGLEQLAASTGLRELSLAKANINDEGLRSLTRFQRLEVLDLSGTALADQGLMPLHALRQLRHLNVQNTHVTASGIAELVEAHSGKLEVHPRRIPSGAVGGGGIF